MAQQGSKGGGARLMPADIQQKEFRVSRFGGYKMRDVDEFLDQLTESMTAVVAEAEQLRRHAGAAPVVGAPDLDDVSRQADEIIARAREEAARIVAEAKERAASFAGASAAAATSAVTNEQERAAVNAFLAQEREFLQGLAGLVQGHAETVKGMARKARGAPSGASAAAPAPKAESPAPKPPTPAPAAKPPPTPASKAVATPGPTKTPAPQKASAPKETPAAGRPSAGDVTQAIPAAEEPVRVSEPEPAAATVEGDRSEVDPSLRDLFWGEES